MDWREALSLYEKKLLKRAEEYGGWVNAHAHLDRADTLDPRYWERASIDPLEAATLSLKVKQNLTGELHKSGAYSYKDLKDRMAHQLERMICFGTKMVASLIDATPDIGLKAIIPALELKEEFKGRIDFRVGTQPIFGFKNPVVNSDRWDIFAEASRRCDFLGALPEKDDAPDRIGCDAHLKKVLELGIELGKEVHVHIDQGNDPRENGTETLIQAVKWIGSPKISQHFFPTVWAVHALSPSCYDEYRFKKLLDGLKEYNIGVICCPRAALSMRQLRPLQAPIHNSVARILEMIKWEIPLRIGTDNIADIFIPTGDANMMEELVYLADSLRFYVLDLWAKIGCGETPNDMDREQVSRALYQDSKVFQGIDEHFPKI